MVGDFPEMSGQSRRFMYVNMKDTYPTKCIDITLDANAINVKGTTEAPLLKLASPLSLFIPRSLVAFSCVRSFQRSSFSREKLGAL